MPDSALKKYFASGSESTATEPSDSFDGLLRGRRAQKNRLGAKPKRFLFCRETCVAESIQQTLVGSV